MTGKAEGASHRRMAYRMLSDAVRAMVDSGADQDWVLGGDPHVALDSDDLDSLRRDGFSALTACHAEDGAFTYLGVRHRSLIDHIFLSPNMANNHATCDLADFFTLAEDKEYSDFANRLSNHRPVVGRLSLKVKQRHHETDGVPELVRHYGAEPGALLRRIADELDRQDTSDA